jgi:hypothetical protein
VRLRIANRNLPSRQDLPRSDTKHDKRPYITLDTGVAEDVAERAEAAVELHAEGEVEAVVDVLHKRVAEMNQNKTLYLYPLAETTSKRCTDPGATTTLT